MIVVAFFYGVLKFGWGGFLIFVLMSTGVALLEFQEEYDKMKGKQREQNEGDKN